MSPRNLCDRPPHGDRPDAKGNRPCEAEPHTVAAKRDARNKSRSDAEAARETATEIEQAVRLPEQPGYHVIPPAAGEE